MLDRVYYTIKGLEVVMLLIGGDKSIQTDDIVKANEILKEIENATIDYNEF